MRVFKNDIIGKTLSHRRVRVIFVYGWVFDKNVGGRVAE